MAHHEYPKRLYIDGKSIRVLSAEEEEAVLGPAQAETEAAPARRGRPPKSAAAEAAPEAPAAEAEPQPGAATEPAPEAEVAE